MTYLSQIVFFVVLAIAGYLLTGRIRQIRNNILLGKPLNRRDRAGERLKTMLLVAFGQRKMFKRFIPAFFHFFIYAGFLIINLEVLEFVLDGILGTHRLFAPYLGGVYGMAINFFEFLAAAVFVACVVFLIRRNVVRVPRFTKPEMKGWPALDGNLILVIECVLMLAILTMNAADQLLQQQMPNAYHATGNLAISSLLIPIFDGLQTSTLVIVERAAWWFHIVGILAFAVYVTYSKHLHIFMAFPNTWYSNLNAKGKFENMEAVTNEVKMMLGMPTEQTEPPAEVGRFGAKDVVDLSWKNLMDAYACTECGRCTSECPANITGKTLSPRKIMMDTRDRLEEYGSFLAKGGSAADGDGKSLLGDYISKEEINACTTCNACAEACPVNIDPLNIIVQMRQYEAMEESGSPASWNNMFSNIENNFAPWKFPPSDRFNWADELKKETSND